MANDTPTETWQAELATTPGRWASRLSFARRNAPLVIGGSMFALLVLCAVFAPLIATSDPTRINPAVRLTAPNAEYLFGTDSLGRDLFARIVYGARISLAVGIAVAVLSSVIGLVIGLVAGYIRWLDGPIMRVMDGMMAIPSIFLAIALVAVTGPSITNVILAITVVEVPRVVRLVRSITLSIREQLFIDAAICAGTGTIGILGRHILPNALAPLIVSATFTCAGAVITEAYLSFLGAGAPSEIPTWGNIMAEGRAFFRIAPWAILIPGCILALLVLSINIVGDGLRDMVDPRLQKAL